MIFVFGQLAFLKILKLLEIRLTLGNPKIVNSIVSAQVDFISKAIIKY